MIGNNIKRLIKEKGLTQRQLAVNSECTESAISRYINGKREPNFATLKGITKALGIEADELLKDRPGEKTNFEKIKSMTVEEVSCVLTQLFYEVAQITNAKHYIKNWLQKEEEHG